MTTTTLSAQDTFISEVYFFSGATGDDEAIEIAGPTGSSLEGWQLLLYDGTTGMVYNSHTFGADAVFPYTATVLTQDYGVIVKNYGHNGMQDGSLGGDGLALVNSTGEVVEFWSYGGEFLATNGPAIGQFSQNMGTIDPILVANGLFSYTRRCIPPLNLICGPNDLPYIPTTKEILSLDYWLTFLSEYVYTRVLFNTTNLNYNDLNTAQQDIYDTWTAYANEAFLVTMNDLKAMQVNGNLLVKVPQTTTSVNFASQYVNVFNQGYYWYGIRKDEPSPSPPHTEGFLSINRIEGIYTGSMALNDKDYIIRHLGSNLYALIEMNQALMNLSCGVVSSESDGDNSHYHNIPENEVEDRNDFSCPVTVLALYTENVRAFAGNHLAAQSAIRLAFSETKQIFRNSDVTMNAVNLDLLDVKFVNFVENENNVERLERELDDNILPQFSEPQPGMPDGMLKQLRDSYHADLVVLFLEGNYIDFGGLVGTTLVQEDLSIAAIEFSAIAVGFTASHEISHLFGCKHANDPNAVFERPHQFSTGGFLGFGETKRVTIMEVTRPISLAHDRRIPHLSNPNVLYLGQPTGITNQRDNARMVNTTACDVADFRDNPESPLAVSITSPSRACECDYVLGEAQVIGGALGNYSFQWQYSYDGFSYQNNLSTLDHASFPMPCEVQIQNSSGAAGLYIKLTVTDQASQTASNIRFVPKGDTDADGNICYIHIPLTEDTSAPNKTISQRFQPLDKVKLAPNPVQEILTLSVESTQEATMEMKIFDARGQNMKSKILNCHPGENKMELWVKDLPEGVYFLNLFSKEKGFENYKFIKIN